MSDSARPMRRDTFLNERFSFKAAKAIIPITAFLCAQSTAFGALVQSPARPFGLGIAGFFQAAESDDRSKSFYLNELPDYQTWVSENLSEMTHLDDRRFPLDASELWMSQSIDNLRVYFIGEGAAFHNSLGINVSGRGVLTGDPILVFLDASSQRSGKRKERFPVQPGDFADVGRVAQGSFLDFFLIANGANGGSRIWSMDKAANSDGINHVVS